MKVYKEFNGFDLDTATNCIWQRSEVTMAEVEEKYGSKIKIIKG